MTESKTSSDTSKEPVTLDELIRTELKGKGAALEQYDSILWKIRSGYVTILYGTISLLGSALNLLGREIWNFSLFALALIWGFSFCAFIIDYGFLKSKFQVVIAKDRLVDISQQFAAGANNVQFKELSSLLHNSGEDPNFPFESDVNKYLRSWSGVRRILILYSITPLIGSIVLVISAFLN